MNKEIEQRARRSQGIKKNIRAAKARARKTGELFVQPPFAERLSPEERLDFEKFIFPNIKDLPNFDDISKHINIVEDFYKARLNIRNNPNTQTIEIKNFEDNHPELNNGMVETLRPAFKLILGRLTQATNIQKQIRR